MNQRLCFFMALALVASAGPMATARSTSASAAGREPSLDQRFAAWKATRAPSWHIAADDETGFAQMIYGGRVPAAIDVRSEDDAVVVAREMLASTLDLHGVDLDTLELTNTLFLPLDQVGSGDKWTVRFQQKVRGVRVVGGWANVLLDAHGALLSVQSSGLPHLSGFSTTPSIGAGMALASANEAFRARFGSGPTIQGDPELVIEQHRTSHASGDRRAPRLAWQIALQRELDETVPDGETYFVDALNGAILRSEPNVHTFDVTGTLSSKASPGALPDEGSNPAAAQIMKYARVQSSAGTIYTDANGNFTYPGVSSPLSVTFTYVGTYNNVHNSAGANYTLTQTLNPGANTVLMNPSPTQATTAQANAFMCVDKLRDYVRSVNPSDSHADRVFTANVMVSGTCNAFYNGSSLNFYTAGGGCVNFAYATIVNHEQGHWMNDVYGTGNGSDGMGEGNADVWALYVWDSPINGPDAFGTGSYVRTGLNTRPFCGDTHPGCYGEVHNDGEVWMGAAWKVRARLQLTNGHATGTMIADNIFLGWMNSYNQTQIRSIIETQWLTLDDNDGNINNGTPHFADIDLGFRAQAFPGVTLTPIGISNVTALPDTTNSTGPYAVGADVVANSAPPLASVVLRYQVGDAAFVSAPMTHGTGSHYSASIPGQPSPSIVRYYVQATDNAANTAAWPNTAPEHLFAFDVGTLHTIRSDDFEGAAGAAWTSGSFNDTSNNQNDWLRGVPMGKSGSLGNAVWTDPAVASSGQVCFGNDLGTSGGDGAYSANVHNYLRSPVLDCSGAVNTHLRFQSWLTVEGSASDQATVAVNGNVVYSNPAGLRIDNGWATQEYDISAFADHNPSVTIEFRLQSNGTNQCGGWNVDDVNVYYLTAPCAAPSNFCASLPNSTGQAALMGFTGFGNVSLNNLTLIAYNCPFNVSGLFFYGPTQIQAPFGNGYRCVGGPVFRLPIQQTDSFGEADRVLDLGHMPGGAITPGQQWNFQFWYRNPGAGGAGFNLTDGLSVTFCP